MEQFAIRPFQMLAIYKHFAISLLQNHCFYQQVAILKFQNHVIYKQHIVNIVKTCCFYKQFGVTGEAGASDLAVIGL